VNLYGPKQLIDSIRSVRKNTIQIAEDIPEEHYGYRPTPDSRSVAENLTHIAQFSRFDRLLHEEEHVATLAGFDFGKLSKKSDAEEKKAQSKREFIEWLRKSGEEWAKWVEGLPEELLAEQVGAAARRFKNSLRDDSWDERARDASQGPTHGYRAIARHCSSSDSTTAGG